jgi:hypothetical protein
MNPDGGVEILKLARHVEAEPEELEYLQYVAPHDIRDLREQVTVAVFDADRQMLQRLASAAKLIPTKLAAAVAQQALGPLLCARVTGMLDPPRAVDIAARLPTEFLADLAVQLDPRRASRVVAEIPPQQIGEITAELAGREEYIAMGGFVGHLPEAALRAATEAVDDEDLLLTAYVIDAKANLGALVGLLAPERLESIIRTAHEADLWPEALDVLGHVSEKQRGQLGDLAAAQPDEVLDGMVAAAQRDGLWGDVLPVTRAMSPQSRERFATLASVQTPEVLAAIVGAASKQHLWPELLALLPFLSEAARRSVGEFGAEFDRSTFEQIVAAAREYDLWEELGCFTSELEPGTREQITDLYEAGEPA